MKRFLLLATTLLLVCAPFAQAQRAPVTTTSDAARVQYVRGETALAHVDNARARTHFDAALVADPTFSMAHVYRAILAQGEERTEHMRQAMAGPASEGERQMIESYAANLRDDHDREQTLLTALADRFPNDPMPMFWWANTESNRGNAAEAIAAGRRALTADPSFAPAYNLIGYAEVARGDMAAAEQAFRDYVRLAPDEANPYDSYGEFLMNQGKLDEAEAKYEMALTKNPSFENARTMLARIGIMRSDRRFSEAVAAGDADAIAALYTENAIIMPPDSPPIQGRKAIRDYMAGLVAAGIDGVEITPVEVVRFGDTAIERADVTISVGGKVVGHGKSLVVWRLVDGEWLYARDMWSSNAPAASGTH